MSRLFVYLVLIALAGLSCKNEHVLANVPACIRQRIQQLEAAPVRNPPGSVNRYTYKGKSVYYIPPDCCDQFSELIDETCTALCAPDGGLGGSGDGRCPDFWNEATNRELIWQDPRK